MAEIVNLNERVERFNTMAAGWNVADDYGLLKTISLNSVQLERLSTALNFYLYSSLCAWYENENIVFSNNILKDQEANIRNLPNITPNGLVLPKTENCAAYNTLHNVFAKVFEEIKIGSHIESIQYPINIRLQSGMPNPTLDTRPRSSVKPHTDIWAGDPASGMVVFLSLLGDPQKTGIRFLKPDIFPEAFVKTLDDYDLGQEVVDQSVELPCELVNGKFFIMDPYMIHRTTKNGEGLRVSLDFRFIPKQQVVSDKMVDLERGPYFISYEKWSQIGKEIWMSSPESIKSPYKKTSSQDFTIGYPSKINLVETV
jgi:hypothetical protein